MSLEPPCACPPRRGQDVDGASPGWEAMTGRSRSGDSGLAGRDGLDSQFDTGRLADEESAAFESDIPGEAEVLAVDLGGGGEADALVTHGGGSATVEVNLQGDGPGRAVHGQVACEFP